MQTLGKTEENVKEGLSIQDVVPFFEKHRLQLRVFDKFYKLVFKHDPPNRNHHNKVMHCMMSDGHIYTLNHLIDKLAQFESEHDDKDSFKPAASDTFYIKEEKDVKLREAKMIATIEDFRAVVQEMGPAELDEKKTYTALREVYLSRR